MNRVAKRMGHRTGLPALLALAAMLLAGAQQGLAQTQPGAAGARTAPAATAPEPLIEGRSQRAKPRAKARVQARTQPRTQARPRPQIRVQPRYPYRRWHSPYPLPYSHEFPGPHAKRQCVNRYVTEHRPSGTVVVPRMRCWWVRG